MTEFLADVIRDAQRHLPAQSSIYEIHSKKDQRARFNTSDRFASARTGAAPACSSPATSVLVASTIPVPLASSRSPPQQGPVHSPHRPYGTSRRTGRSDIVLQNFERGFLHFQLDDLPVNQLHTSTTLRKRSRRSLPSLTRIPKSLLCPTRCSRLPGRQEGAQEGRPRP